MNPRDMDLGISHWIDIWHSDAWQVDSDYKILPGKITINAIGISCGCLR